MHPTHNIKAKAREDIQKEFFTKFGANKIWVKPSKGNVETILDIWAFIERRMAQELSLALEEVENIEVSCVRDSLLGKSDDYLDGWNECSIEWRKSRDEAIKILKQ